MKRRSFLGSTFAAGAIPLLHPVAGTADREGFAELAGRRGELDRRCVADLQQAMSSGESTASDLVKFYRRQIAVIDARRGGLNAVIESNPDAPSIATSLDGERAAGKLRGPLHGIPVMIKDNIASADQMETTAGSLALVGARPREDAFIVKRLRAAGGVLLGKTNLSEWANFRSDRSSSGWSSRGGQTRNAYVLDRNPCGSSSGSAVAAAASLCTVTIGTETDGSIVCPSSANGVVGLKPTVGLWSRSGIIPISATQDTAGPIGRTVADVAALLGPLTGVDPNDSATGASAGHSHPDYTPFLDADGLRGRRIGILRSEFGFHEDVDAIMEQAIELIRSLGAVIIDPVKLDSPRGAGRWENTVLQVEFKDGVNRYLAATSGGQVRSLADVITFNQANAARTMPYFGQSTLLEALKRPGIDDPDYLKARDDLRQASRRNGIDATLKADRLDAIMAPTGGPAWTTDLVNGDHFGGGSSGYAARAGYPNITVPAGLVHGLPVGMSLFSTAWREPELIAMAHAFEVARPMRFTPTYLPSLVSYDPRA